MFIIIKISFFLYFRAKERHTKLISYFSPLLEDLPSSLKTETVSNFILSIPPYQVSWDQLAVHCMHRKVRKPSWFLPYRVSMATGPTQSVTVCDEWKVCVACQSQEWRGEWVWVCVGGWECNWLCRPVLYMKYCGRFIWWFLQKLNSVGYFCYPQACIDIPKSHA